MNLRLDDWLTHIQEQGSTADEYLQYWQYFHRWYELDENAIPAEFVLRELHSVNDSSFWQDVVPTLRKALMDLPCDRDCPDIRVGQSVTEWETRYALHLMKRHSHSATFPSTSNETPPVVVIDEQQKNRMLWLHRHFESGIASTDDVSGLLADQHLDPDVAAKLNELLRILRDHLGHEAEVYSADSEPTERERAFSASAAAPARGLSSSVSSSLSSRGGRPLLLRCASSSEYLDVIHQRQLLKQQSVGSHGSGSQHPHQTFGRYPPLPMSRQSSIQYTSAAPPPEHPRTDDDIQHQLTLNGGFDSTTRLREMLHHCHWAMEKVTTFIGREVLQQKILDQLQAFANTIAPTSGAGLNRKKPQASPGKPLKSAISLVLVGESGCGKTALMARMAQLLYTLEQEQWLASSSTYPRRPVIIRFCGTSSASTNALALMQSIIHQVTYLYDVDLASLDVSSSSSSSRNTPVGTDTVDVASSGGSLYHQTVQQFHRLLAKYPVLLLLDSLDQLSDDYEARSELSFLKGLNVVHPRTRIIVSTLPDETISTTFNRPSQTLKRYAYQCDSRLQEWHVPRIVVRPFGAFVDDDDTEDDADGAPMLLSSLAVAREVTRSISQESEPEYGLIVRHILTKQYGRTLTTAQWTYLLHQAAEEPTALYLQLACRVISSWSSFPPSNPTATSLFMELSGGVVHVIHQVLDILEYTYGQALVRMVLGYITTAQSGIRDSEMCDLLSLDDGVMHEVFQYALTHTPTMSETIDPWDGSLTGGTTSTVSVKRVPYHVWTRVRLALEGLLVEKEDGGLRWYHRQLQEVSEARFGVTFLRRHCSNHDFWRRSEDVFATEMVQLVAGIASLEYVCAIMILDKQGVALTALLHDWEMIARAWATLWDQLIGMRVWGNDAATVNNDTNDGTPPLDYQGRVCVEDMRTLFTYSYLDVALGEATTTPQPFLASRLDSRRFATNTARPDYDRQASTSTIGTITTTAPADSLAVHPQNIVKRLQDYIAWLQANMSLIVQDPSSQILYTASRYTAHASSMVHQESVFLRQIQGQALSPVSVSIRTSGGGVVGISGTALSRQTSASISPRPSLSRTLTPNLGMPLPLSTTSLSRGTSLDSGHGTVSASAAGAGAVASPMVYAPIPSKAHTTPMHGFGAPSSASSTPYSLARTPGSRRGSHATPRVASLQQQQHQHLHHHRNQAQPTQPFAHRHYQLLELLYGIRPSPVPPASSTFSPSLSSMETSKDSLVMQWLPLAPRWHTRPPTLFGHRNGVRHVYPVPSLRLGHVGPSPSTSLVSHCWQEIKLWDLRANMCTRTLHPTRVNSTTKQEISCLTLTPSGDHVVVCMTPANTASCSIAQIWHLWTGHCLSVRRIELPTGAHAVVSSTTPLSRSGNHVTVPDHREVIACICANDFEQATNPPPSCWSPGSNSGMESSEDDDQDGYGAYVLFTAAKDRSICVWWVPAGEVSQPWVLLQVITMAHRQDITRLMVLPSPSLAPPSSSSSGHRSDGSWLASAAGNLIKIWPLDEDFLRHRRRLSSAAGSSNSHRRDKKATSLPCLATLTGHQSTIAALQVLPAPTSSTFDVSPLLLSAGREDCSIRLWQLVSRRFTCVYSWSPHRVALTDLVLTLSPSSGRGGSGSGSSSSRLHDSLRNTDPFHDEDEVEGHDGASDDDRWQLTCCLWEFMAPSSTSSTTNDEGEGLSTSVASVALVTLPSMGMESQPSSKHNTSALEEADGDEDEGDEEENGDSDEWASGGGHKALDIPSIRSRVMRHCRRQCLVLAHDTVKAGAPVIIGIHHAVTGHCYGYLTTREKATSTASTSSRTASQRGTATATTITTTTTTRHVPPSRRLAELTRHQEVHLVQSLPPPSSSSSSRALSMQGHVQAVHAVVVDYSSPM
eukprot:gene7898-5676_t